MPSYSGVWTLSAAYQAVAAGNWPYSPTNGPIGLFGGGASGATFYNVIDKVVIATTGNAVDFGDLTRQNYQLGSAASSTRGRATPSRRAADPGSSRAAVAPTDGAGATRWPPGPCRRPGGTSKRLG